MLHSITLYHLLSGTKRFNELKRLLPAVTHRMFTHQLRELEDDRIGARRIYPEVPPRVDYSLTYVGRTLEPVLQMMRMWGTKYLDEIVAARREAIALDAPPSRPEIVRAPGQTERT